MLTQHLKYVTPKVKSVKFLTVSAVVSATVAFMPLTAQASPGLETIVKTEYSAKFKRALFESEAGLKQVYETLQSKAQKACKIGTAVGPDGEIISKSECITDLLDQFIESAGVTTLTAYHSEQEKLGG